MSIMDARIQFLRAVVITSFGCLLIGFGSVFPIYHVSTGFPQSDWGGYRYASIRPIRGVVSYISPEFRVTFEEWAMYDVWVSVGGFYTNGTPVILRFSSSGSQTTIGSFYNVSSEPVEYTFWVDDPPPYVLTILYLENITSFSGWILVQGIQIPPPMPPSIYPWVGTFIPATIGLVLLVIGLDGFWIQKRESPSRYWNQVLVFCTLGLLLLSLSFPSVVRPHYFLFYKAPDYNNFGEFAGTVTLAEPVVAFPFHGLQPYEVGLYGFHVTFSSVTIRAYTPDGLVNYTWNNVDSQYPNYQDFVLDASGDTVIEVVRETADTSFRCWLQTSYRPVEVRETHAGAYAPFATLFLVTGVILLSFGLVFMIKGFKDFPEN
ncbi:MAG: hypothetical protein ACFE9D_00825 [Promethearchaeota archaeon]